MIIDFVPPDDPIELRDLAGSVRRFAKDLLAVPQGADPQFRRADFEAMAQLGLTGMVLPESHGGSALGAVPAAVTIFEIARLQLGPAIYLSVHLMVSKLIADWSARGGAIDAERDALLRRLASGEMLAAFALTEPGAGSDARALRLRADRVDGGYRLTGEKIYITSGTVADVYLVFARTSEDPTRGISAFIVPRSADGIQPGKAEKKMGCEGAPISALHFDQCFVPLSARLADEGLGLKIAMSGLNGGRTNIAAAACGIASRAIELSCEHVRTRQQFGQAVGAFQGVRFMLADMATKLQASILLTREAARRMAEGPYANTPSAMAKRFATDAAMEITTDAVQLLGGAGYLADYEVERLMRDAKMLQIVEGTNQIQRVLISRWLLGDS